MLCSASDPRQNIHDKRENGALAGGGRRGGGGSVEQKMKKTVIDTMTSLVSTFHPLTRETVSLTVFHVHLRLSSRE